MVHGITRDTRDGSERGERHQWRQWFWFWLASSSSQTLTCVRSLVRYVLRVVSHTRCAVVCEL